MGRYRFEDSPQSSTASSSSAQLATFGDGPSATASATAAATTAMRDDTAMLTKKEQRRIKRQEREERWRNESDNNGGQAEAKTNGSSSRTTSGASAVAEQRKKLVQFLSKNETELLDFVIKVNTLYEDKLKKPAPFMTFVLVGMQSSGKSTFMERLLNAVVNIVQEGTGTRCPLDVTCINDTSCSEPRADLSGPELDAGGGEGLAIDSVFELITGHNKKLADEDRFSTESLKLVYRSNDVQNMRFVDTPGIITNQSKGSDNREDIKSILRKEIGKSNTKLCVLLEATEFSKNPIIDFLDNSLDGRDEWKSKATFLMPKFDKQMEDSRTASKANSFFTEFTELGIYPHLVVTPTLDKEDLPADELFIKRNDLLKRSSDHESEAFKKWLRGHEMYRVENEDGARLDKTIEEKIGFPEAQATMRKEMLEHTLATLPKVVQSLQEDLNARQMELQELMEKQKFTDPAELKVVVKDMLHELQERVVNYLDGDLLASMKYKDRLQTLDDEIDEEEFSHWSSRELNEYSGKEEKWSDQIEEMEEFPDEICPRKRFLGGKQVQRAIEFFRAVW